ncbi:aminotransferase [Hwanghaeella grinnelliae]|uniref:Aminotransferase n=1 Tax=Hwanghaeella grinnelliae TaxID=2500179 RepID=A0A437QMN1_9PROT|nr:aminotransferase [Hwanghaeella grinnelliae]RVU35796.1 aminotransferase [Hwanghaeella grinnelliae]
MTGLSNSAAVIREYDNKHYMHPWESMEDGRADRTISARAEGIYIYDQDGKKLIDGPGGMWCTQIGYGRQEIADAISEQVMQLSYHSPWNTASEPSALLARKLAELAPGDLNTVFFTTGGSTAVDTAMRFVHFYNNRLGRPDKKIVISRQKAYHGSTYLAASVTGKERSKSWFDIDTDQAHLLPDVNPNLRPEGMDLEAWCDLKVADLENAIIELGPDKVGAFIAEPILASGGVIIPPPGYHKKCLEVCHAHDVLYISDEVVTGFGRLGHWFASEDVFDIVPDMITCAKGLTSGYLPLGACLISDRILAPITGEGQEGVMFSNGYTYSGHPVSCAAALKNIEIMERENILQHVRDISPYFLERLNALGASPIIADTRGVGLVGCVEGRLTAGDESRLALDQKFGSRIDEKCEELGLIVRPLLNMCVFSPPLIITRQQIDDMFDILGRAIETLARETGES